MALKQRRDWQQQQQQQRGPSTGEKKYIERIKHTHTLHNARNTSKELVNNNKTQMNGKEKMPFNNTTVITPKDINILTTR